LYQSITQEEIKAGKEVILSGWGEMVDLVVSHGKGAVFWDIEGKEYIDCTSQAWSLNTGFNHPRIINAARGQLDKATHIRSTFYSLPQLRLAKKLSEIAPGEGPRKLKRVSFCLHGSVAVEGAMKIALKSKGGGQFLALFNGYHGRTLGSTSVSWPHPNNQFLPYMGNVIRVPAPYCYRCPFHLEYPSCSLQCANFMEEAIEKMADSKICALIMEPIQGNGGQIIFPPEFHARVRQICDKYEFLLIYDEIQTAFGRVPAMFACQLYDVIPDIIIYGKALGGGFPIAGTLSREELARFSAGDHGFTFGHFPVSLAAALENLRVIEDENLLERCKRLGDYIITELDQMKAKYELIGDIRGCGLMIGVELVKDRETKEPARLETQSFVTEALKRGVLFGTSHYAGLGNVVKIKPPVVITDEQVDRALEVFEKVLRIL
jgi:4-aminobutyrate aminotransferase/4-aminobutyrate aminotransferase/(S)-3-amino-2-methylpropionate transaminase